ncbi:MAG: DUF262 domain-containing protein [Arcobacteraceae bacterium]|jgi:uncharacterized protein with ParB-like and HNH nuclease domain|nr:DUF262 domain-containing protein [Arcobacteraceae bacterium]
MSFQLRAEQKKLTDVFNGEIEYSIPDFQRPYSWGYSECYQLYSDIFDSFERDEEFFLGNIVIASSKEKVDVLQLVDGQQRTTTLLLWIKALYLLYKKEFSSEHGGLKKALYKEDWETANLKRRLKSNILETKDDVFLGEILDTNFDVDELDLLYKKCISIKDQKIEEKKCKNKFERNFIYFYYWSLNDYKEKVKEFIVFLLKKVMLLPMQLDAESSNEAIDKALRIFETINNRGMDLTDSDILKAKIYTLAIQNNEGDLFIKKWIELRESVENMNLKIDDIFRFYSHIIRGKEKIVTSEIGLREFFTLKPYSPLKTKKYEEILDDLYKIVYVYDYISLQLEEKNELSKWLQIINAYSNQYPKVALIVYLYYKHSNGIKFLDIENETIEFSKNIVRYVYHKGATATVKNEIYSIIKDIAWDVDVENYNYEVSLEFFDYMGRLKKGFALLAYYLNNDINIYKLSFSRLITYSDNDFNENDIDTIYDTLGNYIFLDLSKKNISFENRIKYFDNSELFKNQVNPHLIMHDPISFISKRDSELKKQLVLFMKGEI